MRIGNLLLVRPDSTQTRQFPKKIPAGIDVSTHLEQHFYHSPVLGWWT